MNTGKMFFVDNFRDFRALVALSVMHSKFFSKQFGPILRLNEPLLTPVCGTFLTNVD